MLMQTFQGEGLSLGDRRLDRRLERLTEDLAEHPEESFPQACGSWAATLAAYRFCDNPKVTLAKIVAQLAAATLGRCRGEERVIVVQDTTSFDFTDHPQTEDLGVLEHQRHRGLFVHTSLAVAPAGIPLGVIAQQIWARAPAEPDPTDHRRHTRPLEGKETAKWVRDWQSTATTLLTQGTTPILVADQEADIYEVYATAAAVASAFVIRARHDRAQMGQAERMIAAVEQTLCQAETPVEVTRREGQPERTAHVEIRFLPLTIAPPDQAKGAIATWWQEHPTIVHLTPGTREPLALTVILVTEPAPPEGVKALRWVLLTNLAVTTPTAAVEVVAFYRLRWLVERFHFVLKSGCHIETLQLRLAERIERAIALYSGVAWLLLWLTYAARIDPAAPCTQVVDAITWQALWTVQRPTTPLPSTPPSLHEFVRQVARLGGFLGRKGDGEPGVKTLWRGQSRLVDIDWTYRTLIRHPDRLTLDPTCV